MKRVASPMITAMADTLRKVVGSLRTPSSIALLSGVLLAASSHAATLSMSWTDNSGDETGFVIERSTGLNGAFVQIGTVGPNVTTYVDTTVVLGTQYAYRVAAVNDAGTSAYTNVISNAPVITTQPVATQAVNAFTAATMSVVATSELPLTYQWKRNGTDVTGATNATLTIPSASTATAGTYTVVVSNGFSVTSNNSVLTITPVAQNITFGALAAKTYGDAPFTVSATASSGLPVTFSIASGPATATGTNGSTITLTAGGTVVVRASQAGDGAYNPATVVDRNFAVSKALPIITWNAPAAITYGTALSATQLNATASVPGTFTYNPVSGSLVAVGVGRTLGVSFTPTDSANYFPVTATTTITVNQATPTITTPPTAAAITVGQALSASALTGGVASVSGNPVPGTFTFTSPSTVPTVGSASAGITFTPTDNVNISTATGTVAVTVNKVTPVITWPAPAAITYGTALSATQLNATSSVPSGTFTYNPVSGTVLTAGAGQTLNVTFTPTDTTNNNSATGSTTLTVNKATPTITTPPTASALTYGQAVSASSLTGGTASVAGTFTFTTPATVLNAGASQSVGITFTPTDTANYNPASGTTSLTVAKATPTITTAPSASTIFSNQTLSASTLSGGVASVPGTFSFTTPGTTLAAGANQPVSVTFTPSDATNYNAVTNISATITINPGNAPVVTPVTIISLPVASAITLGQSLSSSILSGGAASVAGTFVFTNPGEKPTATGPVSVTFVPAVAGTPNSVLGIVFVTVNPAGKAPVLSSPGNATATVGTAFSFTVAASETPTGFTATGLPAGLSLNATTGAITGTPTAGGTFTVTVGASNSFGSVTGTLVLVVAPGTQTIAFGALTGSVLVAQPVTLSATASSGLPVTFSIVSGNASIVGNTLTVFSTGAVVVRASQAGDASFNPASATLSVTNILTAAPAQVFFGKVGNDDLAATIASDGRSGTLFMLLSATGEALVVNITINADGTFNVTLPAAAPAAEEPVAGEPARAAAGATRTFTGRVVNGVLTGSIVELGLAFNGTVQPATGATSGLAGAYTTSATGSATGTTYVVVGTQGQTYALSVGAGVTTAGLGTTTAGGAFTVTTPKGTVSGSADAATTAVTGTLKLTDGTSVTLSGLGTGTARTDRVVNFSSRGRVIAVDASRPFIAGFVVTGTGAKQVLLRAVGPGLTPFGVTDALANPSLQVFNSQGRPVAQNDDWSGADLEAAAARVGAFKLTAGSRDAALLSTLEPGAYTMAVTAATGSGIVLAEVYDASANPGTATQQLANISTRGFVETGDGALIAGFAITGNSPKKVLVRGAGPALTPFGVTGALTDPTVAIRQGNATVAENDNWETPKAVNATQKAATAAEISAAAASVGAFGFTAGSKDAAVVITLAPGNYTAVLTGTSGVTGAALVEVYELP